MFGLFKLAVLFCSLGAPLFSEEVLVKMSDIWLKFNSHDYMPSPSANRAQDKARNYAAPLTHEEKNDISFIITTLAKSSTIKILKYKSAIEKAGDRINHIHPLRFIEYIFTQEELTAGFRAIRKSSLLWKGFFSGMQDSLNEEAAAGNIKAEYLEDFSHNIKISLNPVKPAIAQRKWQEFVDYLIDHSPKTGDSNRYDF